ncbi:hypothetical protein JIN84_14715 [Luteolibacter yonseiensis]|uniref:DoxX family protein n=1 Tax=Luteolibacter yonseiensis TaxID=1144680 RepID=A0A934VC76_9BACT|nr:hypothetical protein [Luteolibacter yonseiensis]MBK1816875.1 hypothetical protein [Luteolibacter yonseiensis]
MKHITNIAGGLLGAAFVAFSLLYFFKFRGIPPQAPEGSPIMHFYQAFGPTGYMDFVKVCELIGGILCAIPLTRNIGLLFLGPVILNIIAYHAFVDSPASLVNPVLILFCLLAAYLLWAARAKFTALLNH